MSFQPVINSLIKTLTDIINFIPRLVNGLIILLLGYIISALVRWLLRLVFRSIRLDQLAERAGINNAMSSLGVRASLSDMLAQIAFFFLLLSFATSAVSLVGLTALADLLQGVLHFIPRAISAAILVVFGSMLARFLCNAIIAVADNVNIAYGKALGKIIEYAIVAFVVVLAISTLGVDTTILTTSFTIIIAAAGLAIALTFASGSRESARNVIAGFYVRQNFRPGQRLTLGEYSGKVRSTAGAYTVLDTVNESGENTTISLPNFLLTAVAGQEDTSNASTQPAVSDQENTTTEGNDQPEAPGS
ncbi:MAG: mechanosensitive ion channel [Chloroflexi bacterium]|nr:MAG: mechanosensitive ion channel [Chloroflexota bacterium]